MLVPVYSSDTQLELADKAFGREFNPSLVHQLLVSYQAGSRSGSHKQKTRAEVRGGGKKPWRQKGTGKARAGTIRGPIWRGGGMTFAKRPRDYSVKVNRKAYCAAMQCIISRLLREERLIVVEDNVFHLPEPRVKSFRVALQPLASVIAGKLLLMVSTELITNLVLGSRNLQHVRIQHISGLDPVSLVKADITLISRSAMENLNTSWQS